MALVRADLGMTLSGSPGHAAEGAALALGAGPAFAATGGGGGGDAAAAVARLSRVQLSPTHDAAASAAGGAPPSHVVVGWSPHLAAMAAGAAPGGGSGRTGQPQLLWPSTVAEAAAAAAAAARVPVLSALDVRSLALRHIPLDARRPAADAQEERSDSGGGADAETRRRLQRMGGDEFGQGRGDGAGPSAAVVVGVRAMGEDCVVLQRDGRVRILQVWKELRGRATETNAPN